MVATFHSAASLEMKHFIFKRMRLIFVGSCARSTSLEKKIYDLLYVDSTSTYGHTKVKAFRIVLNDLMVGMHITK